jgi:hypothetical protein
VIATRLRGSTVFNSETCSATSATFPGSEFVGGAFHAPSTIIIAYFYICNNNFHFAK